MLIWWTNQADCEAIDDAYPRKAGVLPHGFDDYICDQYRNRYGRNGRGRLWVDRMFSHMFGVVSVEPWPSTPLGQLLGEKSRLGQTYAGIVIHDIDALLFDDMPGIITTLSLTRARF